MAKVKRKRALDTRQLRQELDDAYELFMGMVESVESEWDAEDAVKLETAAHRFQGLYFQAEKVEDLAGALAIAIGNCTVDKPRQQPTDSYGGP